MRSSTCTLPPLSDIFLNVDHNENNNKHLNKKGTNFTRSSVLDIANLLTKPTTDLYDHHVHHRNLKGKRKRASPNQLQVLNRIFSQSYFPSTEIRIELGKQLGMSPRTVQIWFQNKRQALRSRGRPTPDSPPSSFYLPPISPPRSPPSDNCYYQHYDTISLPPLRMIPTSHQYNSPTISYPSPNSMDQLPYREY